MNEYTPNQQTTENKENVTVEAFNDHTTEIDEMLGLLNEFMESRQQQNNQMKKEGLPDFVQKIREKYSSDDAMFNHFLQKLHDLQTLSAARKEYKKTIEKLCKSTERKVAAQKEFIDMMLRVIHGDEFFKKKMKLSCGNISYRQSKKTEIIDEEKLPTRFVSYVQEKKIDKKALLKELKENKHIAGATLLTTYSLQC